MCGRCKSAKYQHSLLHKKPSRDDEDNNAPRNNRTRQGRDGGRDWRMTHFAWFTENLQTNTGKSEDFLPMYENSTCPAVAAAPRRVDDGRGPTHGCPHVFLVCETEGFTKRGLYEKKCIVFIRKNGLVKICANFYRGTHVIDMEAIQISSFFPHHRVVIEMTIKIKNKT